uniref:Ribosomal protein L20 n=1 Tax=Malawimonas californiana TaxID=221722 RepID=A0A0B5GMW2_MALCL|nr:ribosomal protein L20 [Malawimonas californiana]AJF22888.1 ribosomal protein L20 [Malawimonas californiana]
MNIIRKNNRSLKYSHMHNKEQRKLKISQISNYIRNFNTNYSTFSYLMNHSNICLNRKVLYDINLSEYYSMNSVIYILK